MWEGRAAVYGEITDELLATGASSAEHLDLLRGTRLGAAVVVPMVARGRTLGALALANDRGRPLDDDVVALAEEVASRAATAIDNGRLFRERTLIAQTLQASLLPPQLPEIPGIDLAARHVAGGAGVEVGGDFYDVFRLDEHRFVAVLGDVCGRGVDAATVAVLCRHTVRSAVVTTGNPAAILAHVNEVLIRQVADAFEPRFCTAVVAVGAPTDHGTRIELAVGGHPLPLVRRADGTIAPVGCAGFLLGVAEEAKTTSSSVVLDPGDALVFVTDGVLERRRAGVAFGEAGLAEAMRSCVAGDAEALATAIESAAMSFSDEEVSDDLAVLVVGVPRR
jgi:serine phosphatase RsbU (regulator of sigma subunit)